MIKYVTYKKRQTVHKTATERKNRERHTQSNRYTNFETKKHAQRKRQSSTHRARIQERDGIMKKYL